MIPLFRLLESRTVGALDVWSTVLDFGRVRQDSIFLGGRSWAVSGHSFSLFNSCLPPCLTSVPPSLSCPSLSFTLFFRFGVNLVDERADELPQRIANPFSTRADWTSLSEQVLVNLSHVPSRTRKSSEMHDH